MMLARHLLTLSALALGAGVAACRPAAPRRHVVEMKELGFTPSRVEVAVGDTIVWIDHDLFPHTATGDSASGWEVGPLLPGGEGSHVMGAAGTSVYHCRLHPTMVGTIVVAQR